MRADSIAGLQPRALGMFSSIIHLVRTDGGNSFFPLSVGWQQQSLPTRSAQQQPSALLTPALMLQA